MTKQTTEASSGFITWHLKKSTLTCPVEVGGLIQILIVLIQMLILSKYYHNRIDTLILSSKFSV